MTEAEECETCGAITMLSTNGVPECPTCYNKRNKTGEFAK